MTRMFRMRGAQKASPTICAALISGAGAGGCLIQEPELPSPWEEHCTDLHPIAFPSPTCLSRSLTSPHPSFMLTFLHVNPTSGTKGGPPGARAGARAPAAGDRGDLNISHMSGPSQIQNTPRNFRWSIYGIASPFTGARSPSKC
ncbi:hypothetical protein EVAR_35920_1 [Eumeta japonica]|uniref:Uncharacterized protein n=1 Tax=Eumeta variegata TaxID=151549 RepID=A0A4C1W3S3_EUMVA|nr:hypothetical protein EVAR_35920_1 [Eumeta japonica]